MNILEELYFGNVAEISRRMNFNKKKFKKSLISMTNSKQN